MPAAVAVPRDRHLDDAGRELRQLKPVRRRETTRRGLRAVTPHSGADASGGRERAVGDEVDTATALPPASRPNPPVHGVSVHSAPTGVGERYDAVLAPHTVIQHTKQMLAAPRMVPMPVASACLVAFAATNHAESAEAESAAASRLASAECLRPYNR